MKRKNAVTQWAENIFDFLIFKNVIFLRKIDFSLNKITFFKGKILKNFFSSLRSDLNTNKYLNQKEVFNV